MSAIAPDFPPGALLPGTKYRIVKQIGIGGMGVVYQVVKPPEIQAVLKLMSSELTAHEEYRTRFLDEVRVLAQLEHPNIVRVFDYDALSDGTPFYVMELLHGRTVRDVLETMGTIPPRVAFEITRQLCEALQCAHTHSVVVVHRDIKPENIFLHAPRHGDPVVKLIDFGVVALSDRHHDGTFVGTWKYAAPEQIRGERATPQSDIYAVGLVLYEMLCGSGPFERATPELIAEAHLREMPPPVSKLAPWVPPSVVELLDRALAKNPRQRPRDAFAFAERLFELEWANDGKDPNDRTTEGPLSRILSTVGGSKPSSKNLVAAPPHDRLGNMPVIGVPAEVRYDGPTLRGVGGQTGETTFPGEDALLAGLEGRSHAAPLSKKAREPGELRAPAEAPRMPDAVNRPGPGPGARLDAPTQDAPPSDPKLPAGAPDPTTQKRQAPRVDTDTFSSQEADALRLPRGRGGKFAAAIGIAAIALLGIVSFVAYRGRAARNASASANANANAASEAAAMGVTSAEVTALPALVQAPSASAASAASVASAPASKARPNSRPAVAPSVSGRVPTATKPATVPSSKPDESFTHTF